MKFSFTYIIILLAIQNLFAQHETDQRVIGFKYVMKFNGSNPQVLTKNFNLYKPFSPNYKGAMQIPYANSISDTLGNLLFYYDGATLYQPNGEVMDNGRLHDYNFSSYYNNVLIVPIEESNRRYYYLFETIPYQEGWDYTKNEPLDCPPNSLCLQFRDFCKLQYHIIDMNVNQGQGGVLKKNIVLVDSVAPSISGVKHQNNIDTWVSVLKSRTNKIYNYRVNSCEIYTPVINIIPDFEYPQNPYLSYLPNYGLGFQMVYSTMGDFVAFPGTEKSSNSQTFFAYCLFIAPFDNQTGLFDFNALKKMSVRSGICANFFSHDSKYLYYHDSDLFASTWIFQYNLISDTNIPFYFNADNNSYAGVDYGKNNDIIIYKFKRNKNQSSYKYVSYLGEISNIDQAFVAANLIDSLSQSGIEQPDDKPQYTYIARNNYIYNFYHPDYKKPNFSTPKSIVAPLASPMCYTSPVHLAGHSSITADSMFWFIKKDGAAQWQKYTSDTFDLAVTTGTYKATYVSFKYCLGDSATQQFTVEDYPAVHLADDTIYTCESKPVILPTNTSYSYHWENAHGDVVPNLVTETGQFNMVVQNSCGTAKDSLYVSNSALNIANLVTVNNDQKNDCWKIQSNNSTEKIQVSIYNSWGSTIFSDNSYQNNWCPMDESDGIYYYDITYNNACIKKGWLQVMH